MGLDFNKWTSRITTKKGQYEIFVLRDLNKYEKEKVDVLGKSWREWGVYTVLVNTLQCSLNNGHYQRDFGRFINERKKILSQNNRYRW